jgi:XTP/dITP diphosphohydrolase
MPRQLTGPVVIATHNPGKLKEMRELLAPFGVAAQSAGELGLTEPKETGSTFAENAALKALAAAKASGQVAFADDSGLVVDALNGEPGIHSSRWAGSDKDFRSAMNAARISSLRSASPGPTATSRNSKAASMASRCGRRVAIKASATIRCSSPTASTELSAR